MIFFALNLAFAVVVFHLYPETSGRWLERIDDLFLGDNDCYLGFGVSIDGMDRWTVRTIMGLMLIKTKALFAVVFFFFFVFCWLEMSICLVVILWHRYKSTGEVNTPGFEDIHGKCSWRTFFSLVLIYHVSEERVRKQILTQTICFLLFQQLVPDFKDAISLGWTS